MSRRIDLDTLSYVTGAAQGSLRWWISPSVQFQVKGSLRIEETIHGSSCLIYDGSLIGNDESAVKHVNGALRLPPKNHGPPWTMEGWIRTNARSRVILLYFPTARCFTVYEKIEITIPIEKDRKDDRCFIAALQRVLKC